MAEVKEKRYPFPEDVKKKEKMDIEADKGVYTAEKGPPPSSPDMGSVEKRAKGGLVTSRGQGKVMRTKKTRIC
jgi:hypothetical protein